MKQQPEGDNSKQAPQNQHRNTTSSSTTSTTQHRLCNIVPETSNTAAKLQSPPKLPIAPIHLFLQYKLKKGQNLT